MKRVLHETYSERVNTVDNIRLKAYNIIIIILNNHFCTENKILFPKLFVPLSNVLLIKQLDHSKTHTHTMELIKSKYV